MIILTLQYSNEDQAFETRQALHGISWPMSNPKKLHVEYATKEDMEVARESCKEQPVTRKTEPLSSDPWQQDWNRDEKINTTKVRTFTNKMKLKILFKTLENFEFNLTRHVHILGDRGERMGFRQRGRPTARQGEGA